MSAVERESPFKFRLSHVAHFDMTALNRLHERTSWRLSNARKLRDTTSDAAAWERYNADLRYFEDVLALVNEASDV